jgi:hypothetical protein
MLNYSQIEELDDKEWISDMTFCVDVTFRLKSRNKGLKGKGRLTAGKFFSIKAFKFKLRLWVK